MLDNISIKDVPDRYEDILQAVGIDGFVELVKLYGGTIVYLPTVKSLCKAHRNRIIKEDFKGNFDETARKYGLSRSQVYNIINHK